MSMIDIGRGFRQYDAAELRSYAYRNLLVCGNTDLSDFLEYIFQGMISEEEAEQIALAEGERGYDKGFEDGKDAEYEAHCCD